MLDSAQPEILKISTSAADRIIGYGKSKKMTFKISMEFSYPASQVDIQWWINTGFVCCIMCIQFHLDDLKTVEGVWDTRF